MSDLNAQSLVLFIQPGEDLKDAKSCPLTDITGPLVAATEAAQECAEEAKASIVALQETIAQQATTIAELETCVDALTSVE